MLKPFALATAAVFAASAAHAADIKTVFVIALENLYLTGTPLIHEIVRNWATWENGVPE